MSENNGYVHPVKVNRRVLPLWQPEFEPIKAKYLTDAPPPPPRFEPKPPQGAPNILLVLLDDMGFGAASAFGGPIPMQTAERIAARGKKMNRFHTTAVCSPTRAALLSGYNHHSVNMGNITELCTAYPGNLSTRPRTVTPLARVLKENGYNTAMFGKCHEVPAWENGPTGPFEHWPTFSGFDKFYGFIGAETNQYHPELYDGVALLPTPTDPYYHLTEDLASRCSQWIRCQKSLAPDRPFFAYLAPGATHSPHHVPRKYVDKFRGQFADGWDVLRQKTYENMKKMGIIPENTKLAAKPEGIADWTSLSPQQKEICARQMEVYAGFAYHTDEQVGRVIDTLEELGIDNNTLVIYILGDNGAAAEGGPHGSHNEFASFNRVPETEAYQTSHFEELGTESSYGHYAEGWAVALDAPFTWVKGVASDFGGTRNGLVISYPDRFSGGGTVCSQFHHVIDIAPTILEICAIPAPVLVDGIPQKPMEGLSMVYALEDPTAPDRRTTQYFRVMHHYGIYHDSWMAGVIGKTRWHLSRADCAMEDDPWELYNVDKDFSCADNLAQNHPDILEKMKAKFFAEARKYNALPLDPRGGELFNPHISGRPSVLGARNELTLYPGMTGLREESFPNTKNRSFTITAEIEVFPGRTDGVIFCIGGRFGGYALYVKDGFVTFCYNWIGREKTYIRSSRPLADQRNHIRLQFLYDGGGTGQGGTAILCINNFELARGRIERTISNIICSSETASVGLQRSTPVSDEYTIENSHFSGEIYSVTVRGESR